MIDSLKFFSSSSSAWQLHVLDGASVSSLISLRNSEVSSLWVLIIDKQLVQLIMRMEHAMRNFTDL